MKKLTPRYRKWLIRRAKRQRRNLQLRLEKTSESHKVYAWLGGDPEVIIAERRPRIPPSNICLSENTLQSIEFLQEIRDGLKSNRPESNPKKFTWLKEPTSKKGHRRTGSYTDFSKIEHLSTSAALVLTAEYHRSRDIIQKVPPTINLHNWQPNVFKKLFEIGFFEVLGLSKEVSDRPLTDGDVKTMRIFSGSKASDLHLLDKNLKELGEFIETGGLIRDELEIPLNSSLSEAMANVAAHAYPASHEFRYRHIGKWWVTASADRLNRELTVVIYDQGASIPVTFPRKKFTQHLVDFFAAALLLRTEFEFENDGAYIEGAMRPGRTQTNQIDRGLGLPEMKELIDVCGRGSLSIFSRGGECKYEYGKSITRHSRPLSIGGTLIEWRLHFPGEPQSDQ